MVILESLLSKSVKDESSDSAAVYSDDFLILVMSWIEVESFAKQKKGCSQINKNNRNTTNKVNLEIFKTLPFSKKTICTIIMLITKNESI